MSGKFTQQELRQLMKEKSQSKKIGRIESPIAKYDDKNNLWCILCNATILSESLWSSHLVDKSHKRKIEELKEKKLGKTENKDNRKYKRNLPLKENEEYISKKVSKFDKISEFSQKEILIKQAKKEESKTASVPKAEDNLSSVDPSLPQDFFDGDIKSNVSTLSSNNGDQMDIDPEVKKEGLPEGFFDNPFLDAKARKPNSKDPFEEQMQLFRKEIAEETLVSENILEDEIEQLQKEKDITEIEEQLTNWAKVDKYQKSIDEIHKRKLEMSKTSRIHIDNSVDDTDDSDDENLNDINFWRSKDIFH